MGPRRKGGRGHQFAGLSTADDEGGPTALRVFGVPASLYPIEPSELSIIEAGEQLQALPYDEEDTRVDRYDARLLLDSAADLTARRRHGGEPRGLVTGVLEA